MGPPFPKVIIVSLDFFTFNTDWTRSFSSFLHEDIKYEELPFILKQFVKHAWATPAIVLKSPIDPIYGVPAIGLSASSGVGFRLDGSYQYGWAFDGTKSGLTDVGALESINTGGSPFQFADEMDVHLIEDFKTFVELCKRNGIALVGVTMPYSAALVDAVEKSDRHGIWRQFRGASFQKWLSEQGVIYFDFTRTTTFGGREQEFIDVLHPTEPAYVRILLAMLKDERFKVLLPRIDPARLEQKLLMPLCTRSFVTSSEGAPRPSNPHCRKPWYPGNDSLKMHSALGGFFLIPLY